MIPPRQKWRVERLKAKVEHLQTSVEVECWKVLGGGRNLHVGGDLFEVLALLLFPGFRA